MDVFDLFAKISIDTSEYEKGLNEASGKTSSFGDKLKSGLATAAKVGVAAVGAATTAATAFAAASVQTGMSFDSSMSQVMATMGYSVAELNDKSSEAGQTLDTLRNFAMEMGSTTAFSASQAADALNYMALAGYDAETSMNMLPTVLNLAAAGSIDLASASDMITDAQSALGLSLDETVTMVDQMAMASSKSNTSVAQLGEAILTVGGTAKNLAGGTTELSTALGILADNGIKGSEGGTALRNIMLSLSAPTDKAAKLMNSLGLEVYDANGNMRPLNETFGDLNSVLSTMTQGEQTQVLNSIFNKVDLKSVNALLAGTAGELGNITAFLDGGGVQVFVDQLKNAGVVSEELVEDVAGFFAGWYEAGASAIEIQEGLQHEFGLTADEAASAVETMTQAFESNGTRWDELSGYIDNAANSAQNMADVQLDNLAGDITLFQSALEGAQIVISDQLTPNLREFVQFGSDAISTLSTAFQEGGLTGAMEALGTILSDGLNMVIEQLPKMVDAGMQLLGALGQGLLDNLPVITDAAVEIILMLADGLIEALPALAEGAVQIITELANGIGEALPELIPKAYEAVAKFVEGLTNPESINSLLDAAVSLIGGLIEGLANMVPLMVEYGPEIVVNLVIGIISAIPKLVEVGAQLIMGLIEGLIQGVMAIPAAIAKVVGAIVDGFKALFGIHSPSTVFAEMGGFLIEGLLQGISEAWETIVTFFSGAAEALINFLGESWNTIKEAAVAAWEAIGSAFEAAWDAITAIWSGAVEFFGSLWSSIQTAAGEAASAVSSALSDAWNAISAAWSAATGFFSSLWSGITNTFAGAASWFGGIFSSAWTAVTTAWSGVTDFFSGVWNNITSVFSSVGEKFKSIGKSIVDGLKNGVLGAWSSFVGFITDKVGGIVTTVKNLLGIHSPSTVFAGIGENMALGLGEGWNDEYAGIKRKIASGLDFGTATVGLAANGAYSAPGMGWNGPQTGFGGGGDTYVTINSPVAVDAVTAAREWKKTTQRLAMGYV